MRPGSFGRRALRVLGFTLGGILALMLVLLGLLLIPGVRGAALPAVVARAVAAVPGELDVGGMRWSRLGALEFEAVHWTADGDTLAVVDRIAADVDLRAMFRGDLHVRRAEIAVARADVPKIQTFLAENAPTTSPKETAASAPSIPSVVIDRFEIDARQVTVVVGAQPSEVELGGSLDLRRVARPRISLDRVRAAHPAADLVLGPGSLEVDLAELRAHGEVTGHWRDDWSFALSAETPTTGTVALKLAETNADGSPHGQLELRAHWPDAAIDSLHVDAELLLPPAGRLATIPGLESMGTGAEPNEQLRASITGAVVPAGASELQLEIGPFAGLESGRATIGFESDSLRVSQVRVRGDGLRVDAEATVVGTHQRLTADVRVDGTNWLAPWVAAPPDSVRLNLRARVEGPRDSVDANVRAEGYFRQGTTTVDSLRLVVQGGLPTGSGEYEARARVNEFWIAGRGRSSSDESFELRMDPWFITSAPPAESTPADETGRVRWDSTNLVAEGVRILGDLGDLTADAHWNAEDGAEFSADASWREAPAPLLATLTNDADTARDIAARWAQSAGALVRAEGTASAEAWKVDVDLALPEPSTFTALLPEGVNSADLGPASGRLQANGAGTSGRGSFTLTGDGWIEEFVLRGEAVDSHVVLDTLRVDTFGLRALASGHGPQDDWVGALTIDLPSVERLRPLLAALPSELTAGAAADIQISGDLTAPNVTVRASANAADSAWSVPGLLAEVDVRNGVIEEARVWAADTVRVGTTAVERFALQARSAPGAAPGAPSALLTSFEAQVDSLTTLAIVRVASGDSTTPWTAAVDSLTARWADRDLTSTAPFFVRWQAEPAAWELDGLDLRGGLGKVTADGAGDVDAIDLRAAFDLHELPLPASLDVPAGGWPKTLRGTIAAARRDSLAVDVIAGGLTFGPLEAAEAHLVGGAGATGTQLDFRLTDAETTPILGRIEAPHRIDLLTGTIDEGEGTATARFEFADAPLPSRLADPAAIDRFLGGAESEAARLNGEVDVHYSRDAVRGEARADVTFPDEPRLKDRRLQLNAKLVSAGLDAQVHWISQTDSLATIELNAPSFAVSPADGALTESDEIHVRARLNDLQFDELTPLLPRGTHVAGTLRGEVTATGPREEMTLDGWLEAIELVASTPEGNRARAGGRLKFSGTTAAPKVDGDLEVTRANVVIPAPPRVLHPTSGDALLWKGRPDSVVALPPPPTNAVAEAINLGINVAIPGACRLRGRGLDVELAGDLSLVLLEGRPRVEGVLQAVRGTLRFVGTRFTVQQGTVTFFGTEAIDPNLDVRLTNRKGDLVAVVHVTGRSSSPTIRLTSEPPMEEADILANLLFGRASDDLDREQTGFLESQATAALQMFAAPGLERALGSHLGLDLVRLTEREGSDEQLSVVVGKYLSPRALLSYDQALDRGDDFAINLEYWLTRNLRFETTTSRQTQSGVQLNWTRDY